jgi:hypothetical protein
MSAAAVPSSTLLTKDDTDWLAAHPYLADEISEDLRWARLSCLSPDVDTLAVRQRVDNVARMLLARWRSGHTPQPYTVREAIGVYRAIGASPASGYYLRLRALALFLLSSPSSVAGHRTMALEAMQAAGDLSVLLRAREARRHGRYREAERLYAATAPERLSEDDRLFVASSALYTDVPLPTPAAATSLAADTRLCVEGIPPSAIVVVAASS